MDNVKQYVFDTLVEEFSKKPGFLLARTLFLFCNFNPAFEMPANIKKAFISGLMDDEVRAFSLRYHMGRNEDPQREPDGEFAISLAGMKKEIHKQIAAENLSKGTGKVYSPSMVEKIACNFRSVLSYNEILEVIILSAHKKL